MNDSENRTIQTFVRVQVFGQGHLDDFAANSLGRQLFTTLDGIIDEVNTLGASEVSGFGSQFQGTTTRRQCREALRTNLEAISRTARAMAIDVQGLEDKFRVPRNNNDAQLLAAGRAFATDAAPLSAQFIAHELPADFLAHLNADIAALEAAIENQSSGADDHIAASAAIDDAMERGLDVLRKLDAIIKNKYANNPMVLAGWASARHVERAPRRSKSASPTSPPAPTPNT